jgi:hypothetical protein
VNVSIEFEIHVDDPKKAPGKAMTDARAHFTPRTNDTVSIKLFDGRQKYGAEWYFDVTATWTPRAEP